MCYIPSSIFGEPEHEEAVKLRRLSRRYAASYAVCQWCGATLDPSQIDRNGRCPECAERAQREGL